ncbi:MAG: SpoIIE family protein phosphatase [Proteobacteria bacterium]|nr:SpoIIE family protein phosphatase [Pseudomonadota bacterium]
MHRLKNTKLFWNRVAPRFFITMELLVCLTILIFSYLTLSNLDSLVTYELNLNLSQTVKIAETSLRSDFGEIRNEMDQLWNRGVLSLARTDIKKNESLNMSAKIIQEVTSRKYFKSLTIMTKNGRDEFISNAVIEPNKLCLPDKSQVNTASWITSRTKSKVPPLELIRINGSSAQQASGKCIEMARAYPSEGSSLGKGMTWVIVSFEAGRIQRLNNELEWIAYFDRYGKGFNRLPKPTDNGWQYMPTAKAIKDFVKKADTSLIEVKNNDQDQLIAYNFSRLPDLDDLICIVATKSSRTVAILAQLQRDFTLSSIILALMTVLVAMELARRIARPIRQVTEITNIIASGSFDVKVPPSSLTEISQLGHSINKMSLTIRDLLEKQHRAGRMSVEINAAHTMQKMILPASQHSFKFFKTFSYSRTASECGGDLWGAIALNDGRYAVYIGDATGHGVASAFVAVAAHASFCAIESVAPLWPHSEDTAWHLMQILNRTICDTGHGKILMTMLILVIDPVTRTVCCCNAGHLAPLHLHKRSPLDNYMGQYKSMPGSPLGFEDEWKGKLFQFQFEDGDMLALYTDGIIDNPNHKNKKLNQKKLKNFILHLISTGKDSIDQRLRKSYEDYLGGVDLIDDSTLVIIEFPKKEQLELTA